MTSASTNLESGYIPGLRIYSGVGSTLTYAASDGWNLVSVPVVVSDFHKTAIYPTATSSAFGYKGGYTVADTLANGVGYWVKFSGPTTVSFSGPTIVQESVKVVTGWNMIGPPSYPVPLADITPVGTTVSSQYFAYAGGSGYLTEDTLQPGSGYWVKVSQAGTLFMKTGSVLLAPRNSSLTERKKAQSAALLGVKDMSGVETLTITDAAGIERLLYFSATRTDIDAGKYEMPPLPPEGTMDVRFRDNRLLEVADTHTDKSAALLISSASYPVTIGWTGGARSTSTELAVGGRMIVMRGASSITLSHSVAVLLKFHPASEIELPTAFALYQNYPNPFNPSTTIRYDLPGDAHVSLKIYNTLGQEVSSVKDEVEPAGYRSVVWNTINDRGMGLASGVYFYRIEAAPVGTPGKPFVQVRKMMNVR